MIWGFAGINGSFLVAVFSVNQLHAAGSIYRLTFSQRAPRKARPHEVGRGRTVRLRWLHARIHVLHGSACFPRQSRLRLDDQHAAQSPCLTILVPLGMRCLIDSKLHLRSGGWPPPLPAFYRPRSRSAAPVTSRCTRSGGVQCLRIGCTASSVTSLHAGCLARASHAGAQQAPAAQHCTRYDSNALGRKALH